MLTLDHIDDENEVQECPEQKIHGYTMGFSDRTMPEFAEALDSPPAPYDTGDGTPSPMPERLVELANYLESIQAQ